EGYSATAASPKKVFVKALQADARAVLSRPVLEPSYCMGAPRIMLTADQMRTLPDFFADIPDPRRRQGRRHPLPAILAIAAGAILCGMRGYKAIAEWANNLTPKARQRFRCRRSGGPLPGALPIHHPRSSHPRRPGPARPGSARLERNLRPGG